MSELLKIEKNANHTLTITLNRAEVHNAFNDNVIKELTQAFQDASTDHSIQRIVLTGEGKSFCAGADLNWMKSMVDYDYEKNLEDSKKLAKMFEVIDDCTKPVIALVNGHALGGGVGLLCVCDYVLAIEGAKIGFTEVNLGLIPAVISPFCISKIGVSWARALFLSGEVFNPVKAKEIGLVHKVVSADNFSQEAQELIKRFEALPSDAVIAAKNLIQNVSLQALGEKSDFTCEAIARQRISKNGQEGMAALLEKRKPQWDNHDQ